MTDNRDRVAVLMGGWTSEAEAMPTRISRLDGRINRAGIVINQTILATVDIPGSRIEWKWLITLIRQTYKRVVTMDGHRTRIGRNSVQNRPFGCPRVGQPRIDFGIIGKGLCSSFVNS